jgi:hypothetical protein
MAAILVEESHPMSDAQHCAFDHDQEGAASTRPRKNKHSRDTRVLVRVLPVNP